jgi:hypothetical protein
LTKRRDLQKASGARERDALSSKLQTASFATASLTHNELIRYGL